MNRIVYIRTLPTTSVEDAVEAVLAVMRRHVNFQIGFVEVQSPGERRPRDIEYSVVICINAVALGLKPNVVRSRIEDTAGLTLVKQELRDSYELLVFKTKSTWDKSHLEHVKFLVLEAFP